MAKVEVKIDKNDGSTYTVDKFNGLKSVQSLSQSTGQPKEIYYGVMPSSGKIDVIDIDSQIESMIKSDNISNSNVNVNIYINDNLIHNHKSSDSDYSIIDKKFSIQLSDILEQWDSLQYSGYNYQGSSETAYNMLVSVLNSLGFDETTEIPSMLEEVATKLQAITISVPFLARDTYRATIDKFCALAQMQVYQADDGTIKFVNARPTYDENTSIINIYPSNELSQLKKSIILKNKYDAVDITPTQMMVDNHASVTTESFNSDSESNYLPSDKELTNTISGQIVNNSNLDISTNSKYTEGQLTQIIPPYETKNAKSGVRIEVYYMRGYIEIEKPSAEQYLDFYYNVQMSGKRYTDFTWTNTLKEEDWTSKTITSYPKLYSSASVPMSSGTPTAEATWSGGTLSEGANIQCKYMDIQNNQLVEKYILGGSGKGQFIKTDLGSKYSIYYDIPVGYFKTNCLGVESNNTWTYVYGESEIKQADQLTISITASKLTKQDLDTIRVGDGDSVYTYNNNELLSITSNDTLEQSQYYKNAQNIIEDYSKGIPDATISVTCGDYLTSSPSYNKLNWSNGEVIQVDDLVNIDNSVYKVTGRNIKYSGVPKIDLELQSLGNQFCKLNFTGIDANGKLEGQQDFDGTIVAYAVGKPRITINSNNVELITYPDDNGFNAEYYNNYNFSHTSESIPTKIIEDNVFIPPIYNNKPVIKILNNAFYGYYEWSGYKQYSQGIHIQNVILSENIQEIGGRAFYNAGYTGDPGDEKITIHLPSTLEYYDAEFAHNVFRVYVKSNVLPRESNVSFGEVSQIIYEDTVTQINGLIVSGILVFKHSANAPININIDSSKEARPITIYSDNTYVNNYNWASKNFTATIKPLSEWVE